MATTTVLAEEQVLEDYLTLEIPLLEPPDELKSQLKAVPHKNINEADHHIPRDLVTDQTPSRNFYFKVCCRRPRIGTYLDPAQNETISSTCLVVFDFTFTKSLTDSRYKKAKITIDFLDKPAALLSPDDQDDDLPDLQPPRILDFEPRIFRGEVNQAEGSTTTKLEMTATPVSAGISSLNATAGYSKSEPFIRKEAAKLECHSRGRPPSTLIVALEENRLTEEGIIPRFSIPIVVGFVEGRVFAARVKVQVDLAGSGPLGRWLQPAYGKNDDPIWFDGELMRKEQKLKNGDDSDQKDVLDGKAVDKLREITGLAEYGGRFLRP